MNGFIRRKFHAKFKAHSKREGDSIATKGANVITPGEAGSGRGSKPGTSLVEIKMFNFGSDPRSLRSYRILSVNRLAQLSQPLGHDSDLGHEAIRNGPQNNFMNVLITDSHYSDKCGLSRTVFW